MKAKITRTSGTTVELEGTSEEIGKLLKEEEHLPQFAPYTVPYIQLYIQPYVPSSPYPWYVQPYVDPYITWTTGDLSFTTIPETASISGKE